MDKHICVIFFFFFFLIYVSFSGKIYYIISIRKGKRKTRSWKPWSTRWIWLTPFHPSCLSSLSSTLSLWTYDLVFCCFDVIFSFIINHTFLVTFYNLKIFRKFYLSTFKNIFHFWCINICNPILHLIKKIVYRICKKIIGLPTYKYIIKILYLNRTYLKHWLIQMIKLQFSVKENEMKILNSQKKKKWKRWLRRNRQSRRNRDTWLAVVYHFSKKKKIWANHSFFRSFFL